MLKDANALRFAVIGCGGMASQVHVPNMAALPGAVTVAYCDIIQAQAERLLATYGGEYATTNVVDVLADTSIDGVLIQVGPAHHPRLVQQAAAAGKHIFVEKPIAIDLGDALDVVRAVEQAGVKFIFGTCNRLAPMVQIAKRMCPQPLYTYCQCAESVTHQAVHNLDLAVNLFHDAPLRTVYASGGQYWNLDPHLPADSFSAVLTFEDGSTHTYFQHGKAHNSMLKKYHFQLFGADRCVYLAHRFKECHLMVEGTLQNSWRFEGLDADRGPFGYMGHYQELEELVRSIREGGNGTMTVRDAAYVLAVEKAILQSITSGTVVDFPAFLADNDATFLHEEMAGAGLRA